MEAVKKYWFWGIFISILSIFAMSHNANAININFENYTINKSVPKPTVTCENSAGESYTGVSFCSFDSIDTIVKKLYTTGTHSLKAGDIIEFNVTVFTRQNYGINGGTLGFQNYTPADSNIIHLNTKNVDDFDFLRFVISSNYVNGNEGPVVSNFYTELRYLKTLQITQYVGTDGTYHIGFDTLNRDLMRYYQVNPDLVYFFIHDVMIYRPSESKENKEVEEKTQEAVDESQSAGGDSSTSAQTGTTGLLNAITGAVSVISSAQPTNCKINGNMGNLDIGQLDLCANPAPAFVQTIGSLILILMCVPLAISLFNRFIAIFRSFQS